MIGIIEFQTATKSSEPTAIKNVGWQEIDSTYRADAHKIFLEIEDAVPENLAELTAMRDAWTGRIRNIVKECRQRLRSLRRDWQSGPMGLLLEQRAEWIERFADGLDRIDLNTKRQRAPEWPDLARKLLKKMEDIYWKWGLKRNYPLQ